MGLKLSDENIQTLLRTGDNTVQLPASTINIGGQQYKVSSTLSCDISTNGFGGLDIGSPTAHTIIHFFAVVQSGAVGLIGSLNPTLPAGFLVGRYVGAFNVNHSTILGGLLYDAEGALQEIRFFANHNGAGSFAPGLANGVTSKLLLNTVIEDTHRGWDTAAFVWHPPIAKIYDLAGSMFVSGSYAAGGWAGISVRVNAQAGPLVRGDRRQASASGACFSTANGQSAGNLIPGDAAVGEIGLVVHPTNWASVSLIAGSDTNWLKING